jgi:hypothetical protein
VLKTVSLTYERCGKAYWIIVVGFEGLGQSCENPNDVGRGLSRNWRAEEHQRERKGGQVAIQVDSHAPQNAPNELVMTSTILESR